MYMNTYKYDRLEASFYAGFHRQVFALAISWIIFCCAHGYAGNSRYYTWSVSSSYWFRLTSINQCLDMIVSRASNDENPSENIESYRHNRNDDLSNSTIVCPFKAP